MRRSPVLLAACAMACTDLSGASDLGVGPLTTEAGDAGGGPNGASAPPPSSVTTPPSSAPSNTPTAFDFEDVTNVALGENRTASAVVSGFSGTLTASVSGADAQIKTDNTPFAASTPIVAGDHLEVRMTSSTNAGTKLTATVTLGGLVVDWTVTTAGGCPTAIVEWSEGEIRCSVTSGDVLAPGASRNLTDSTGPDTGKIKVTCRSGQLETTEVLCEPPHVFNVNSATGCVNGFCSAAKDGMCSVADAVKATAICVAKGYRTATTHEVTLGPFGNQCNATGTSCFSNANPVCNIVFSSVTCLH